MTGFSVTDSKKRLERQLNILGRGTLLASASVNHGAPEKIETWFRSHPDFGKDAQSGAEPGAEPSVTSAPSMDTASVADEIRKLGELREEGLLSDEEFAAAKRRLIEG